MARKYWRDTAGNWRNGLGRYSSGPKRKVDLRKYPRRSSMPKGVRRPTVKTERKRIRETIGKRAVAFKRQLPEQLAPIVTLPLAVWNTPFRKFVERIQGNLRGEIRLYAILKRTSTTYKTSNNRDGVRIFAKLLDAKIKRSEALHMTIAEVRSLVDGVDPDGVLWLMQAKSKKLRDKIANTPKMRRYLRSVDKGMPSEKREAAKRVLGTLKKRPGGKGKRKRYKATR